MESDHPRFMTQRTPLQIMRRRASSDSYASLPSACSGGSVSCLDSALFTVCYLSTPYMQ